MTQTTPDIVWGCDCVCMCVEGGVGGRERVVDIQH